MRIKNLLKRYCLMALLVGITLMANASPVELTKARVIGAKFLNGSTSLRIANPENLQCAKIYRTNDGTPAFYIFNTTNGYVMVSADDCAIPILGYSETQPFIVDDVPVQMEEHLQSFVEQIQYGVTNQVKADETTAHQWELVQTVGRVVDQRNDRVVTPLVTAHWGQGCYYNNCCPVDPNATNYCGHTLVGCVAVAMGQIMHYWGYPTTGNGTHSYTPIDPSTYSPSNYPQQTANFGATTYNWANMPNSLSSASPSTQINAVATLLWHCGVSVEMMYGVNGSGAFSGNVPNALQEYFAYSSDMEAIYRSGYQSSEWVNLIKSSLDQGQPVYYSGSDTQGQGGHAFVCDGYDANNFLHFNWGWYGNHDDYFADGALNVSNYQFNDSNFAIINIHPQCTAGTSYQVTATCDPTAGTVTGSGSYECGTSCTVTATPNSGYQFCSWTENGTIVSTNPSYSFSVTQARNLVADFIEIVGNMCSIVFELNDSYGDGWNGNALTVSYSAGCFSYEEMSFGSGNTATFTRNVVDGSNITLGWIPGSYTSECSFTIRYENGTTIYSNNYPSAGLYYAFDVYCQDYLQITAIANPTNGGIVTGAGTYTEGSTCTLHASPRMGYDFVNWVKDGVEVASTPTYSFTVTESAAFVANFESNSEGNSYTTYDWQTNSGAITRTVVWDDGMVNFAYTQSKNADFSDRGTGISTYNATTESWTHTGERVENSKTGFGSIARYGENGLVLASHTAVDCRVYIIPDRNNIQPNSLDMVSSLPYTYDPCWPNVMTSGANRDIIHVIASAFTTSPTGLEKQPLYFRSQDGGQTWDKQNEVLPFTGSDYCGAWNSNNYYWMETTEDNCLALVVNNPWSDGMVLYSYDDGETWQRKVFYQHPGPFNTYEDIVFLPRYTSCQWDSNHKLHVLYEFNGTTGEPGSGTFYPGLGGVAYWNEDMPYNANGTTNGFTPGQPFVMNVDYLNYDIYQSWWLWTDASHEMWPEYIGYLPPLNSNGEPEDPYNNTGFNISETNNHGSYNSGTCGFPVLCMDNEAGVMVAVWCALDENNLDVNGKNYYKLFASCSIDGGSTWTGQVALTNNSVYANQEFVWPQAAIVNGKLIVAVQTDNETGTFVLGGDTDCNDNYYECLTYELSELFDLTPTTHYTVTVMANPAGAGVVTGAGTYTEGQTCNLMATANAGYTFVNWTKDNEVVSSSALYSFVVTESAMYMANFEVLPDDELIIEPFEEYTVGAKIATSAQAAGHNWWTTWSNAPGSSEDGVVASFDGHQCGHLTYGNDQVLLLGDEDNGNYDLEFDIYVPEGKNGYFNILHHFAGSNSSWAMQCYLHATNDGQNTTLNPGHGTIHAGSNNTADVPCVYNAWMHFRLNVNTDTDIARYYYTAPGADEVLMCEWQWSLDSFGENVIDRNLSAANFFPPYSASTSEYYIDNISFKRIGGQTAPQLSVNPQSVEIVLGEDDITTVNLNIINSGNSIGEWSGYIEFGQGGTGTQTASLAYHDGNEGSGIGSSSAYTREIGARFPVSAYGGAAMGMKAVSAQYFVGSSYQSSDNNYIFRLYGQGINGQPGEMLAEKTVYSTASGQWITATFTDVVYMTGQDIWATVQLEQAAGEYPLSMDGGEYGENQDGNYLKTNAGQFNHCYSAGNFGGAWLITLNCQGEPIPGTWASIDHSEGSLYGGYSETVTLTLNSIGLEGDTYNANFIINTNDTNAPTITVPISLTVDNETTYYNITATANPVEGGIVTGGGTFLPGDICTLSAIPNTGYLFVNWTKNGTVVSNNASFSFNVNENAAYVAHFTLPSFTVTVTANPTEGGVVTGGGIYNYGSVATVTVIPNANYQFLGWMENGEEVSQDLSYSFVVTEDKQLEAMLSFVTDLDEVGAAKVTVYPNPAHDKLFVECGQQVVRCELYTITGLWLGSADTEAVKVELPVNDLPAGMYLVRVITKEQVLTGKFVKE